MSVNASRLTLFAIISAIEEDLRNVLLIVDDSNPLHFTTFEAFFGDNVLCKLQKRHAQNSAESESTDAITFSTAVEFLDFADSYQTINRNPAAFDKDTHLSIKASTGCLQLLTPIRNRVMHGRPLHYDDFPNTIDIAKHLASQVSDVWRTTRKCLERLEKEPLFVLQLKLPEHRQQVDSVMNNLPIPDFDETGFMGRRKIIEATKKACMGPYPVVTIVGEGGIGKTSLVLKVAYGILDSDGCPFDAIIWTSCKTSQLTQQGVIQGPPHLIAW